MNIRLDSVSEVVTEARAVENSSSRLADVSSDAHDHGYIIPRDADDEGPSNESAQQEALFSPRQENPPLMMTYGRATRSVATSADDDTNDDVEGIDSSSPFPPKDSGHESD